MTNIDNEIITLEYSNGEELYSEINNQLMTMPEIDRRIYTLKNIIQADKDEKTGKYCAFGFVEQDLSKVLVEFQLNDEVFVFDKFKDANDPDSETKIIMSYEEIKLLNLLGKITIDDEEYTIKDMSYILDCPETNCDDGRVLLIKLFKPKDN